MTDPETVEMSSESQPEEIDLEQLDELRANAEDTEQLDKLMATTKQEKQVHIKHPPASTEQLNQFMRNFFVRHKMNNTLSAFQQEWYELIQKGNQIQGSNEVPKEYIESQALSDELLKLKQELDKAIIVAEKSRGTYEKLLKERNFYKMHHQRVQQEKKKLNHQLQKLRKEHIEFEKRYDETAQKYSELMKGKMLIKLERDRLKTRLQLQHEMTKENNSKQTFEAREDSMHTQQKEKPKFTPYPPDERQNPFAQEVATAHEYRTCILHKTWRPHNMAVTAIAINPKKSVIGSVSDDLSWKIVTSDQGELVMSGEGHREWVSGVKFHPRGLHLLTCSGDSTIKLWDVVNTSCQSTFKQHSQAVWAIDFHDTGDFFASASMDHLAKIFDINVGKCRHSLRGHVDSVNAVVFQPYSNLIATGSADKTVSLWDLKTSICVQTFYGHNNAVNDVCFTLIGDKIASCDADGILKVWDVRMVKQKQQFDFGEYSINCCHFDKSGTMISLGGENGQIKIYNESLDRHQVTLKGHQGSVNGIIFDYTSKMIYSCGADCTVRVWQ